MDTPKIHPVQIVKQGCTLLQTVEFVCLATQIATAAMVLDHRIARFAQEQDGSQITTESVSKIASILLGWSWI